MYLITGPCIEVIFYNPPSFGDVVMDINFNWSLDVFQMYAARLSNGYHRNYNGRCYGRVGTNQIRI